VNIKLCYARLTYCLQDTNDADLTKAAQDVIMELENFIDPFDLDVFKPHLARNLDRHHQRCSVSLQWLGLVIIELVQVMLGSLSSLSSSSHMKLKGSSVTGVTQEKHNVMPMAPSVAVFTSLPILTPSLSQETPPLQVNRPTASNCCCHELIISVEPAGAILYQ